MCSWLLSLSAASLLLTQRNIPARLAGDCLHTTLREVCERVPASAHHPHWLCEQCELPLVLLQLSCVLTTAQDQQQQWRSDVSFNATLPPRPLTATLQTHSSNNNQQLPTQQRRHSSSNSNKPTSALHLVSPAAWRAPRGERRAQQTALTLWLHSCRGALGGYICKIDNSAWERVDGREAGVNSRE